MTTSDETVTYPDAITSGAAAFSQAPQWVTSYRPRPAAAGLFGYATDVGVFEWWNGSTWGQIGTTNTDNTWTGTNSYTGILRQGSSTASTTQSIQQRAAANTRTQFLTQRGSSSRWNIVVDSNSGTGINDGTSWWLGSYDDTGAFIYYLSYAERASGIFGKGRGYWSQFAPIKQQFTKAVISNGVLCNEQSMGQTTDQQPTYSLPANPFSVTNGDHTVICNWPGACNAATGIINSGVAETWVYISGSTSIATVTPSGWYRATRVDNDHFSIEVLGTPNANTTGGGSAVTVRPSFATSLNKTYSTATTGADWFPIQDLRLFVANPEFYQTGSEGPNFQQQFWQFHTPPETSLTYNFLSLGMEYDLVNRGGDPGYSPVIRSTPNATVGFWLGSWNRVEDYAAGGGTANNWGTVYTVGANPQYGTTILGSYVGFSTQPNALVGADYDPTSHGGVAFDAFGAYVPLPAQPFTTSAGTSTITVSANRYEEGHQAGDTFYLPGTYTISGVTFGGGTYTIANVDTSAHTFEITGTGTAAADVTAGGTGQYGWFVEQEPYAPNHVWGGWRHGIVFNSSFKSASGAMLEAQPGNSILWSNGTGSASVSTAGSGANLDVTLTPAGTGAVRFGTLTASADAPVTGYIEIKDAAGNVRKLAVIA